MSLKGTLRHSHRRIAPWIIPPLVFLALTGATYRIGRAYFGMGKDTGKGILDLHAAFWLGETGSAVYLILVGGLVLFLLFTGLWMLLTSRSSRIPNRRRHRILAILLGLPLTVSVLTGMIFRAGEQWFGLSENTKDVLMMLHQGSWLGQTLRPLYVLFLAIGVTWLCLTGFRLAFRRKSDDSR